MYVGFVGDGACYVQKTDREDQNDEQLGSSSSGGDGDREFRREILWGRVMGDKARETGLGYTIRA